MMIGLEEAASLFTDEERELMNNDTKDGGGRATQDAKAENII
jgi:hypothetical protein